MTNSEALRKVEEITSELPTPFANAMYEILVEITPDTQPNEFLVENARVAVDKMKEVLSKVTVLRY